MADAKPIATRKDFEARVVAKAWRDPAYKKRLLSDPKSVIEAEIQALEPSAKVSPELEVAVHEESATQYHLVLPRNPNDVSPGLVPDDQLEMAAPAAVMAIANLGPISSVIVIGNVLDSFSVITSVNVSQAVNTQLVNITSVIANANVNTVS